MQRGLAGRYELCSAVGEEKVRAFITAPLPPEPLPDLSGARGRLHKQAPLACGRLDAITALLPEPDLFLYACARILPKSPISTKLAGLYRFCAR